MESIPRRHDTEVAESNGDVKAICDAVYNSTKPVNNTSLPPRYRRNMIKVLIKRAWRNNDEEILGLDFILGKLLPVASAQLPDVSNPGWNIGWEVEEDEVMMDLDGTLQFETKLKFWIDNTRPLPSDYDIEVEMTYPSGCDEGSFSIDSESKVNVGANTNETFEIKISGNGYGDLGEPCPTSEVFSWS